MPRWTHENAFDPSIAAAAAQYQVPPSLIRAVIAAESAFDVRAYREEPDYVCPETGVEGDASRGLMQVLECTARRLGYLGSVEGLYQPDTNIALGAKLLAMNYRQARGNWDVAISAYNGGFSSKRPWDAKRDPAFRIFNRDYVARVKSYWSYFETGLRVPQESGKALGASMPVLVGVGLALALARRLL